MKMNNELLLKAIEELASAIDTLGHHLPWYKGKDIVHGHLQRFETLKAELRSGMQNNKDTPPQLNKPDVSGRSEQVCKHPNIHRSDGLDECLDCGAKNY